MAVRITALAEEDRRFLLTFEDDTEGSPWMVSSDYHRHTITALEVPLEHHAAREGLNWYVSSDLPIIYTRPNGTRGQVAPDIMVAMAPNHPRSSFDVSVEGGFPAFVLEVVSPESRTRDTRPTRKVRLYNLLGAREYAFFDPIGSIQPRLQGYRRAEDGGWQSWAAGPRGELHSAVLGLTLVPRGLLLRLEDANGRLLPTPDDAMAALYRQRAAPDTNGSGS